MSKKMKSLPESLREIRKQLDLSQEDLARAIGVSYVTVHRWENGVSTPSKLAKAQLRAFCERMGNEGKLKLSTQLSISGNL